MHPYAACEFWIHADCQYKCIAQCVIAESYSSPGGTLWGLRWGCICQSFRLLRTLLKKCTRNSPARKLIWVIMNAIIHLILYIFALVISQVAFLLFFWSVEKRLQAFKVFLNSWLCQTNMVKALPSLCLLESHRNRYLLSGDCTVQPLRNLYIIRHWVNLRIWPEWRGYDRCGYGLCKTDKFISFG